ncbi:MAG: rod shape-determining protein [SAR324 cluster bacterium]|nr:rod shape-determining protein [SAR324 cluster bacterium]
MKLGMTLRRELIIDIGSSHTVVVSNRKPHLLRVPSLVSVRNGDFVAASPSAKGAGRSRKRQDKTILEKIVFPVTHGRVTDEYAMEKLLREVIRKTGNRWAFLALRNVGALLVPPQLEQKEIARLRALLVDVGFGRKYLLQAPLAAAIGCGLGVDPPLGQMLIDIGGGKTSFAIFSMGDLAAWWQEDFGGRELDSAIRAYVEQRYGIEISLEQGEQIKLAVGSAYPMDKPAFIRIEGREQRTDEPKKVSLEDNEIRDLLVDACERLILAFQRGFEDVPPELAGDIARNGVTMLGGGAMLPGLSKYLSERTGLCFKLANDPLNASVHGARKILAGNGSGKLAV